MNNIDLPSNCYKKLTKHKPWVIPIWITGLGSTGSMVTPYIYEMYCKLEDLIEAMRKAYNMPKEERDKIGLEARGWMQT